VKSLAETRAALRKEIGPPTDRDENWQPMVSAGEVRQLLDALDLRDLMEEPRIIQLAGGGELELPAGMKHLRFEEAMNTGPTEKPTVIYPQPTDVWVCLRSGNHNVTGEEFRPERLRPVQREIIKGLLQAALDCMEPASTWGD
jgi:hypothetical protein